MRKTVKLGEIAKAVGGNGFPKKYQGYKNKDIPFFKVSDMNTDGNEKFMLKSNNFVDVNDLKEMKAKLHPAGTIIFPKIGGAISTNKKRILTKDAAFDNNVMGVVPSNKILPEYLYKFFLNIDLYELSNKAALPSIKNGTVNDIDFVLPPLAEQERIVAKLDAAFAEIDSAIDMSTAKENEVKKLDRFLLENLFKENFDIKKIGDLGDVKSGGTPKSTEQSYWNGEIDWYSSGELNNMYTSQTAKHITNKGLSNSNAKIFPKGSLLVGMYDTAAMKMSILQKEATFNQAIVGIPPNEFALPEYLFYALNFLKPKILLERRGVRQQNLSLAKIKNIDIPIPSMEQQQYIVSQANIAAQKTESILKTLSSKKAQFGILKSAILAQELQSSEAA